MDIPDQIHGGRHAFLSEQALDVRGGQYYDDGDGELIRKGMGFSEYSPGHTVSR